MTPRENTRHSIHGQPPARRTNCAGCCDNRHRRFARRGTVRTAPIRLAATIHSGANATKAVSDPSSITGRRRTPGDAGRQGGREPRGEAGGRIEAGLRAILPPQIALKRLETFNFHALATRRSNRPRRSSQATACFRQLVDRDVLLRTKACPNRATDLCRVPRMPPAFDKVIIVRHSQSPTRVKSPVSHLAI